MEHSSRHLRFKLQSLGRRLDDLEEATRNLQKAEDEVLDLQDKIIQAEGSNSSMLAEVEALRKRVVKIEGKDEEVKKAEDLCRLIKEKLENEENITRELKVEIEQLQKRMGELEKLEEAFNKSKSDCTQLSLSLNEEKNMSKKLTSELEILKIRVKELESSESKLDKAEQFLTSELDKIKSLSLSFVNEKKQLLEREKQNEKLILELKEQLELKGKMTGEQSRNESNALDRSTDQHVEHNKFRIEDSLTSKSLQRVGFDYIKQSDIQTSSNNENEKNKYQEDNKIKELNQEIEKLKNQLKHYEGLEQELKQLKEKHCELQGSYISEQNKTKLVTEELQTLQRQTSLYKEIENGIIESEDLISQSRVKNERKSKAASTESPVSKYTSQDLSPQTLRNDRFKNSELLKKQLSNSSSSSRRTTRSTLLDTTGNLKKEEKVVLSYISSGKDFTIMPNDTKKSKDQPSVLSRYPPAVQEQTSQKSWKTSTSKQSDRSMRFFGEDYSIKAYPKKEILLENEDAEKGTSGDTSENTVYPEETISTENSLSTSPLHPELCPERNNAQANTDMVFESKLVNTDVERKSSSYDRLSRYGDILDREDSVTNVFSVENTKSTILNHEEIDPQTSLTSSTHRSYYSRDKTKARATKPQIPEKPHNLEMSDHRDSERRTRLSGLHSKRQSRSREKVLSLDSTRHSSFENHSYSSHMETGSLRKMSSDGLDNTETNSAMPPRSCSPREALQSRVVIKPIIIERDVKESMSDYRARSSSDVNRTPNKVSSIKIYPSETTTSRTTDEITRERHTSTSNIRLSANDQPILKNNIRIPLEISLNKDDLILKVADKDMALKHRDITKNLDQINKKDKVKENDSSIETVTWKSHDIGGTNHFDSKSATNKSSWRKGGFGSTEELDQLSNEKDDLDFKSRRKSCFDGENPPRSRTSELYSRSKVSSMNSYSSTPDFISKRSQSSLSATEIIARRNSPNMSVTSGKASWHHRSSFEVDDNFNSRRKYSSENLYRTDTAGWKQNTNANQRHQKSMVEERIRQLEH
ncbi:leucine zipper protein 1 [Hyla sarda]|uniref:leucine zipper protein 1 n=1 Tax=Hyla sarda TaxID=327740 RepID=UPI0024C36D01|nr:leucine zipper protein 1 [Hyla sarda]XP_056412995.1 leucine zipper protein 1 [Hyla sarda]XP_056412996.1 leucine zipper protein 1 [Hyla sarda]XP_056412998.1 leucine zipper protein 1 [Hyla sarda]XP_056412999.1 leucine zipper protein 1 [Hyla sarda]